MRVAAIIISGMLIRKWTQSCTVLLIVRINRRSFFKYKLLLSTLMNILAAWVFGRVETVSLVKIESKWVDNLPLSTNDSKIHLKLFHIFKKLRNWKNLVSTLLNIKALLTSGIMGKEIDSRSKFDSIPFYELCLKITTYSIFKVFLLRIRVKFPNFKL